jgi:pimeloyl-ACP methyl ester carboxylesterase
VAHHRLIVTTLLCNLFFDIVLWHGLGPPASERELMKALPLDDVPSVKVYLGLPLFGARAPSDGAESLARRQAEDYASRIFEPVVLGAAKELPAVLKTLREKRCLGPNDAIGLFGFSAGGTAALIALGEPDVPVRAAVTVNAPTGLSAAIDAMERATKDHTCGRNPRDSLQNAPTPFGVPGDRLRQPAARIAALSWGSRHDCRVEWSRLIT